MGIYYLLVLFFLTNLTPFVYVESLLLASNALPLLSASTKPFFFKSYSGVSFFVKEILAHVSYRVYLLFFRRKTRLLAGSGHFGHREEQIDLR